VNRIGEGSESPRARRYRRACAWTLVVAGLVVASRAQAAGPTRYNEPLASLARTPLADQIAQLVARLARQERRTEPRPDARLDAAAVDIARLTPGETAPSNELVEGALWLHGIVEPPPHLLISAMDPQSPSEELLRQLAADLPNVLAQGRYSRLGVGLVPSGSEVRVLLALQESFVDLEPLPRALPSGGQVPLRGQLRAGFERPEVLITAPDGIVTRMALGGDAHRFNGVFACGPRRGRYQLEVVGEDRFGAAVLANFPVWCGEAAPTTVAAASPAGGTREEPFTSAAQAEQVVWKLLNIDRARAGLPALAWDAHLADVARAHSADMQAHNFFGHVSPSTGTPGDRVKRAKIDVLVVLENVARAATAGEAERGLMNSPGHRANIVNKDVTRVGIGVVATENGGQRDLLVTQLFIKPPAVFNAHTVEELHSQIAAAREAHHLTPLGRDAKLQGLADDAAHELARGKLTTGDVGMRINSELDGVHWTSARSVVAIVASPTQVIEALHGLINDGSGTHYGLGIAPGKRQDGGNGFYVILVLGTRR
jgi:uncharacterized protein YkwD